MNLTGHQMMEGFVSRCCDEYQQRLRYYGWEHHRKCDGPQGVRGLAPEMREALPMRIHFFHRTADGDKCIGVVNQLKPIKATVV